MYERKRGVPIRPRRNRDHPKITGKAGKCGFMVILGYSGFFALVFGSRGGGGGGGTQGYIHNFSFAHQGPKPKLAWIQKKSKAMKHC